MTKIAEIVTFRLNKDTDSQAFGAAAAKLAPFLDRTGGFVSRSLSCDPEGLWTDHIVWADLASAQRAAQNLMAAPEAAGFLPMIDPNTTTMRHAQLHI